MNSCSNGTSSLWKNKVGNEAIGSNSINYMCKSPTKKEKEINRSMPPLFGASYQSHYYKTMGHLKDASCPWVVDIIAMNI
jgi:hypothetical protein